MNRDRTVLIVIGTVYTVVLIVFFSYMTMWCSTEYIKPTRETTHFYDFYNHTDIHGNKIDKILCTVKNIDGKVKISPCEYHFANGTKITTDENIAAHGTEVQCCSGCYKIVGMMCVVPPPIDKPSQTFFDAMCG